MSTSKFETAILWLKGKEPLPFGKLVKTLAQKRGKTPKAPVEPAATTEPSATDPASIRLSQELQALLTPKTPQPEAPPTPPPHSECPTPPAKPTPPVQKTVAPPAPPPGPVAVLTLDERGEILAANEACLEVLGYECPALAGQNIRALLKGGLENEVGQFLERHRLGKNPAGTTTLKATALRKDGREFPASITAVTWGWDTTIIVNGAPVRLTWTAAFRNLNGATSKLSPDASAGSVKLLPQYATPPKAEAPAKVETAKVEAPKVEAEKIEPTKIETPKVDPPKPPAPDELALMRKERDELTSRLKSEQAAAAELRRRVEELEKQRDKTAEELQKVRTELAKRESAAEPVAADPEAAKRFEEQLAVLRQERDDLTAKLNSEKASAAEMKYRLDEVEKHLSDTATAKAELATRLEGEMARLQKERDELVGQLTAEQLTAAELNYRVQELEGRWAATISDLENYRNDAATRDRTEAEVRAELETARQAVFYMEAALKEEVSRREKLSERLQNLSHSLKQEQAERSKRFEQDMIALRQERDELNAKFEAEQKDTVESARRAQELEARLKANAEGFERAKADLEKQMADGQRYREQLDTAVVAKKELEGVNKRFEEELANLRKEHDELQERLEQERKAAEESKERAKAVESRLGKNAAEFDRAKAELEKQEAERERIEAEWREQLDAAHALKARLELSLTEARERNKKLEEELLSLRGERNELKAKLAVSDEAAAESKREAEELRGRADTSATEVERLKAALEKQTADEERTETEWRKQLESAQALHAKLEISLAEAKEQHNTVQEELARIKKERTELQARMTNEEETRAESTRKIKDLQAHVDAKEKEAKDLKALLAKGAAERDRAEARWREQQASATALTKQLEADCAEAVERDARVRQQLMTVCEERDELKSKLKAEHVAAEESKRRADDLERRLNRATGELDRAEAGMEKRRAELERAESEWRDRLEDANALAQKFEIAWTEAAERAQRAELELVELEQERDDLRARLAAAVPSRRPSASTRSRKQPARRPKPVNSRPSPPAPRPESPAPPAENTNGHFPGVQLYDFTSTNGHADPKPRRVKFNR